MRWNYEHPEIPGNILALDWYKSHGLDVMAATSAQMMSAMMPRDNSNFKSIKEYSRITSEKKLTGILCTLWDDTSPHFETVWRGIYDFALTSWNYENVQANQAHVTYRHRYYAPEVSAPSYEFQDLLEQALPFWETAFIKEGDRANFHKNFNLIDLPDEKKSGEWSKNNSTKLEGAKTALAQYSLIHPRLVKMSLLARRNAYTLRVFHQINELSIYPAKLLLLLEKYDKAPANFKQQAAQEISTHIDGFADLRRKFETVFSETRILNNPEGYQLDSNLHEHLANGTNNTDWMFMYELPMNDKVKQWLSSQDFSGATK